MDNSQRDNVTARELQIPVVKPLSALLADKIVIQINVDKEAAAIVAQVLTHFGAGYGAERQRDQGGTGAPTNADIFKSPSVLKNFHLMLVNSTIDHFMDVHWDVPPVRAQILNAAFEHGVLARKRVVQDNSGALDLVQILDTLKQIQTTYCPVGAGGGAVCSF